MDSIRYEWRALRVDPVSFISLPFQIFTYSFSFIRNLFLRQFTFLKYHRSASSIFEIHFAFPLLSILILIVNFFVLLFRLLIGMSSRFGWSGIRFRAGGAGIVRVRCSSLFVFHLGRRLFGDDEKERPAALLTSSHLSLARLFLFIYTYTPVRLRRRWEESNPLLSAPQ